MSQRTLSIAALVAVLLGPGAIRAQEPPAAPPDSAAADTLDTGPSPRSAFIKSLLLPGWGQASVDSYTRGGIFFAVQGSSWYMLLKTMAKLGRARAVEARWVGVATDSLNQLMAQDTAAARRLSDPLVFEDAVGQHGGVGTARSLVDSRERHRQDWITYTLFFTFMSAVDAYVTAHLRDFPADFTASPQPTGGATLELTVPVGRRR